MAKFAEKLLLLLKIFIVNKKKNTIITVFGAYILKNEKLFIMIQVKCFENVNISLNKIGKYIEISLSLIKVNRLFVFVFHLFDIFPIHKYVLTNIYIESNV